MPRRSSALHIPGPYLHHLQGWTPLHTAVSAGHDLVVERLIGVDADVNAVTSGGQTPLHYAASNLAQGQLHRSWASAVVGESVIGNWSRDVQQPSNTLQQDTWAPGC
jgi:Ankyrin repeats (3 copies)